MKRFFALFNQPRAMLKKHWRAFLLGSCLMIAAAIYPSNIEKYYSTPRGGQEMPLVTVTEDYARHINSLLPLAAIVILRDWKGLQELAMVTVVGTLAVHVPKRLLNDVEIMGTRLGRRPNSPHSKHNSPSGHSSLASSGAYFMMRRYGLWFGIIVLPVMLLTMYARVMLDAHTVSATIAGALIGIIVTALFTTKWRRRKQDV